MSGRDLFEGMSYVDERFVDEAETMTFPKRTVSPWIKVVSMAACLCLTVFSLYNLQPYLRGRTEWVEQAAGDAMSDGAIEDNLEDEFEYGQMDESRESKNESPADGAPRAPEMMVRILEVLETGFIGTVLNNSGFTVFEDGTEITVMIDMESDNDFNPVDYNEGDLVHIMYTAWDEDEQSIVASILGIVDEPICD